MLDGSAFNQVTQVSGHSSAKLDKVSQALVIGNGESRRNLDLNSLKIHNILIGCNAIHRDVTVDHLVCCDRRMVEEAVQNPDTTNTEIYVREDWLNTTERYKNEKISNRFLHYHIRAKPNAINPIIGAVADTLCW